MKKNYEGLTTELKENKIRLSHQRLKILEYLTEHMVHPTADQVFRGLRDEVPTLSRTTVYHALNALADAGLVRVINIEDTESRYDINVHDHGHFKCEGCGMIHDFRADPGALAADELNGFSIRDKNLYFKGLCPECLQRNAESQH